MKKKTMIRSVSTLISAAVVLLSLSSCSGVIGGRNSVLISVPELAHKGSGRFVTTDVAKGYIVVTRENKVFSAAEYDKSAYTDLVNGEAYITDLPVGKVIFGVFLFNSEDTVTGMAIKEVNIKPGFNRVSIDMGPGFETFTIQKINHKGKGPPPLNISDPLRSKGDYSVSLAHNTIIIDYGRKKATDIEVKFKPSFGTFRPFEGAVNPTVKRVKAYAIGGGPLDDGQELNPHGEGRLSYGLGANVDGIKFKIETTTTTTTTNTYTYNLILR